MEKSDSGSNRNCIAHERRHARRHKRTALLETGLQRERAECVPEDQRQDHDEPDSTAADELRRKVADGEEETGAEARDRGSGEREAGQRHCHRGRY
jgi:hypothetical protein